MAENNYPELCYSITTDMIKDKKAYGKLIVIKWGERGYYPTNYADTVSEDYATKLNEDMDITPAMADAMKTCSMVLNNADDWEEHYNKCLKIRSEVESRNKNVTHSISRNDAIDIAFNKIVAYCKENYNGIDEPIQFRYDSHDHSVLHLFRVACDGSISFGYTADGIHTINPSISTYIYRNGEWASLFKDQENKSDIIKDWKNIKGHIESVIKERNYFFDFDPSNP